MPAISQRPATCSALATLDPTLGEAGCKRLPRHKGEHRSTLHQPRATKSGGRVTKTRRVSKAGLKRLAAKLAAGVESGEIAPSAAMARYAAYVTRLQAQRSRVTKTEEAAPAE